MESTSVTNQKPQTWLIDFKGINVNSASDFKSRKADLDVRRALLKNVERQMPRILSSNNIFSGPTRMERNNSAALLKLAQVRGDKEVAQFLSELVEDEEVRNPLTVASERGLL